jgi:hypothetical protein
VEPREQASLSQAYFIPSGPIVLDSGGKGFARALDAIYEHYKDKPAEMQKALDSLIEGYVNCFWDSKRLTDDDRVRYAYLKDGYNEQNPQKWIQPSAAAVQGYKDEYRNQLMSDIKPLMKEFSERIFHDLKEQLRKTIETEYVPFLNTVVTIEAQVQGSDKTFDKTEFGSDFSMRFSPEQCPSWITSEQYTADYNPKAHSGSNLIYKSTVYNFLQIGNPEEIEFINQNSSNGESDDFYAKLDWSAFPVGKTALGRATEEVGGLTYYSKSYFGNLDDLLNPLMQKQGKFAITSNDGTFSISVATAYSDKSGAPADPENYTSYEETITPSYFTISGELKEGGTCSIAGMISYRYSEDDVEETSGDYYHVIEHWISESTKDVTISGTGTVSFVNNYDDKLGNIKIMVLTFTEISVTGTEKYKLLYKTEFPNDSSLNTTEVKTDTTKALDYTDSFGIEFSVK